jgi:transposase
MSGPRGLPAKALALEVGVSEATLSRWKNDVSRVTCMGKRARRNLRNNSVNARPKDRSPEEKLRLIIEAASLSEEQLGEFLRREALHEADLDRWRHDSLAGLSAQVVPKREADIEASRARKLEKELDRKDKALAEAAALLVLQKKVQELWGDEDDDT